MEAIYRQRAQAAAAEASALDRTGGHLANGRLLLFVLAAGLGLATTFNKLPSWGWWAAGASFIGFLILATAHGRIIERERRAKVRARLNQRGLDRLQGRWSTFAEKGEAYASPEHLYTPDLDVFGQGSLFQRLNETATKAGEALLASWLNAPAPTVEEIVSRQKAVRELSSRVDFRQALLTEARVASEARADPAKFIAWVEGKNLLQGFGWTRPFAWLLPATTLALGFLASKDWVQPLWPALSFFAQLAVAGAAWAACGRFYSAITDGQSDFVRFEGTFAAVTREKFDDARLVRLHQAAGASAKLARFGRLFAFAELRSSGQYHALINVLLLWDIHWLFRLEAWRQHEGKNVRGWFEALAELEALSAMATWAAERPLDVFPELAVGAATFEAKQLGHPLLETPVSNDVSLTGAAWVITGSNMSGKTTLLRSIGLNTVMALSGLPVCAQALRVSQLNVLTSMRVKDSLERGVSYFYAEVTRIKGVLESARAHRGASLFLLDELLMGTNTRERQIASKRLLELLIETGAIGAVTTHDLALTELQGRGVRNVHFRDDVEAGQMVFDYRLREGVVETTNALKLLEAAGVPMS